MNPALEALRHHVSGAVERGEAEPITEVTRGDCLHDLPPRPYTGPSGYAVTPAGRRVCYRCSDEHEREQLAQAHADGAPFTAYLSSDGRSVTTWPGGVLATVTSHGPADVRYTPSGGRYERFYIRALDPQGNRYSGIGQGPGMIVNLRPMKARG